MDNDQAVRDRFSASANLYAASGVHSTGPDFDRMIAAARLRGSERVLDLGTGTAHTALAFAPHVREVVGLDLTAEMLEAGSRLAKERGVENLELRQGAAEALPFADGEFDVVCARQCPHHFRDLPKAVSEAARVLQPGGTLLVVDSISLPDPKLDTFMNAVEILRDPSHVRNYSLREWREMSEGAGLAVEEQADWLLPLEFEDWIRRGGTPPTAVAQLRAMFDQAPDEVRHAYEIHAPSSYDFSLPVGLTRARLAV